MMIEVFFDFRVTGKTCTMTEQMIFDIIYDALKGRADFQIIELRMGEG